MGVLSRLGRALGGSRARTVEVKVPARSRGVGEDLEAIAGVREVDLEPEGEDAGGLTPRAIRGRQELIGELQKNYREVLELVRKFDGHLDARAAREEELARLVESIAASARALPELRAQQELLHGAMVELVTITREGMERGAELGEAQRAALERAAGLLERADERERGVAEALEGVRDSVGHVAGVNESLARTLEEGRGAQERRDEALATALRRSQAAMVTSISVSAALVVLAVVMALVVLMNNPGG